VAYFLSPALVRLRAEVNALWPRRSKVSDGWIGDTSHQARPSDHNPDYSAGGIVRAIDVTNDGINVNQFVNAVIRDERTRYVITRGRIWTRENGWQKYTGPNGHHHHVHVSVRSVGSYDLQIHSWGLASAVDNPIPGGGSVSNPSSPGSIPAAPAKDWFSMATHKDLLAAVKAAFNSPEFRNQVYAAAWVNPRWTVPGTDRKENPAQFLSATRVASVQAVHAAGKAAGISEEDIKRLVDALPTLTAEDVASQLTIGVKEN